jgi:general secretion pathway protein A
MYESFYKLRRLPFALTPDPAFLYLSKQHNFALTMLRYGVMSRAGFCLLTGEVGSGKTLVVRQLLDSMGKEVTVGLINSLTRESGRLLQWVNLAFDLEHENRDDATLYQLFIGFLLREYAAGRRVVLIVDEAQNLSEAMLEQLRVLSNVNAGKHVVLQTFLVGQPELLVTLRQPQLRQFAQRINVDYHLQPLNLEDTITYVRHRLAVAGGSADLFSVGAVALVHQVSGGVPRLINQLCDTALVYAYAGQQPEVDAGLMHQVIDGRSCGGVFPGRPVVDPDTARLRIQAGGLAASP